MHPFEGATATRCLATTGQQTNLRPKNQNLSHQHRDRVSVAALSSSFILRADPFRPYPCHNYALECLIMMALGWQRWLRSRSVVCSLISATKTRRLPPIPRLPIPSHCPYHTHTHVVWIGQRTLTFTLFVISVLQLLCPFMRDLSLTRKI